jgi:hypothetical protein
MCAMCHRTLATLRWRNRAENMNGVWQNRQAYTHPRVISMGLNFRYVTGNAR